jgi:hypothetical protein
MKKKILVTYSVKYFEEVEIEITKEINDLLKKGEVISLQEHESEFIYLENQPEIFDLKIPEFDWEGKKVEYIDGICEVESFELIQN